MAFPASNGSVPLTAERAWSLARDLAASVKNATNNILTQAQASVSGNNLVQYIGFLAGAVNAFNTYAAVTNIGSYAQQQVGNASLNVATEFATMVSDINAVGAWVIANFPKDTNSNLLYTKFNADGTVNYLSFTPAQLAPLVTLMNTLVAQIN